MAKNSHMALTLLCCQNQEYRGTGWRYGASYNSANISVHAWFLHYGTRLTEEEADWGGGGEESISADTETAVWLSCSLSPPSHPSKLHEWIQHIKLNPKLNAIRAMQPTKIKQCNHYVQIKLNSLNHKHISVLAHTMLEARGLKCKISQPFLLFSG